MTRGQCYINEPYRMQTITYLHSHMEPTDTLFAGETRHDRIFASDMIAYFALDKLPASKWAHFDPWLQSRSDIQQQMIAELQQKRPGYITLTAEYDSFGGPGIRISSGIFLLDSFLHQQYTPVQMFGPITILRRNDLAAETR